MGVIRQLIVFFRGDDKDLQQKYNDNEKRHKDFVNSLEKSSVAIGAAFTAVGGAITLFAKSSIEAYSKSEASSAQLNAVLKSTGQAAGMTRGDMDKLTQSLVDNSSYSKVAVQGAESLLLTFTGIKKDVLPGATKAVLNMSTALGQDLKSSSIQLGKALNDPIKGVTALQRVGVSFNATQKEQIKNFVETGRTADAQRLILKELETEFGGSATAHAKTFAGQMEILSNQFEETKVKIGEVLIPVLLSLMEKIKPIIDHIKDWIQKNPELTQKIIIWTAAIGGVMVVLGPILIALPTLIGLLGTFGTAASGLASGGLSLLTGAATMGGGGLLGLFWVVGAIAGVAGIGWELGRWIDKLTANTAFGHWIDSMCDKLVAMIDKLKDFLGLSEKSGELGDRTKELVDSGKVPKYASGGMVKQTGFALVGERGPELVQLAEGSRVYNNKETQSMAGKGKSVSISIGNLNVSGTAKDAKNFVRLVKQEMVKQGV